MFCWLKVWFPNKIVATINWQKLYQKSKVAKTLFYRTGYIDGKTSVTKQK